MAGWLGGWVAGWLDGWQSSESHFSLYNFFFALGQKKNTDVLLSQLSASLMN